jgi:RHS repeat-associated protein
MDSRKVNEVTTGLTWDVTSSLVESGKPANAGDPSTGQGGHIVYAYDASGQRVLQAVVHDATHTGSATAYVASGEVTDKDTTTPAAPSSMVATRYYTFGGATVAMRTSTGLALVLGDEQGSVSVTMPLSVDPVTRVVSPATVADAQAVTRTSYTPFGVLRGDDNLALSRGWLGQVEDRVVGTGATSTGTGLTYLNARYYDPATSRFISPDPVLDPGDPKTLDRYRYADNNPVVFTDASGLKAIGQYDCVGTSCESTSPKAIAAAVGQNWHVQQSRRVIAQLKRDQASALTPTQAFFSVDGSTFKAGAMGLVNFASDAWNRGASAVQYEGQVAWRRARDPVQAMRDDLSFTSIAENAVASFQILGGGAHLVNTGKYCGNAGECLQGGFTPVDADGNGQAITIGHTVTFPSSYEIDSGWVAHEFTHVLQYEILGAAFFGLDYGAEQIWGVTAGHKSWEQAYQDQSSEREARAVAADPNLEPGQNPFGHWFEKKNS